MRLVSTRDSTRAVSFKQAVLDTVPRDGGLYVPYGDDDLRPWILYMDGNTSFSSIAGSLTSALLKEEFSPVVSERIAGAAFAGYSPELRRLDERLYLLELFHGPTGSHKDWGLSWLASALEHILTMEDRTAIVVAATGGQSARSIAHAFAGKKRLKTVIVHARGSVRGLDEPWLSRSGGNIYPVEVDGDLSSVLTLVRTIYSDPEIVDRYGLTLANTMNIGRLLPQVFCYMYAFSRLRTSLDGELFYSVFSGNYGNLVAGLYAWKFCLPVNGFLTDSTTGLNCDAAGRCRCTDSGIPLLDRGPADPVLPSNLERLEQVFQVNPAMLKGLVFPVAVPPSRIPELQKKAFTDYGHYFDSATASAWGAVLDSRQRLDSDQGTVVLVSKDHPVFNSKGIHQACGSAPVMPSFLEAVSLPVSGVERIALDKAALVAVLEQVARS